MRSDVRTLGRFQFDGVGCVGGVAAGVGVFTTTTLPSPLNAASRAARGNLQAPGIVWSFVRKTVSQKVSTISRRRGAPLWNENACAAHRGRTPGRITAQADQFLRFLLNRVGNHGGRATESQDATICTPWVRAYPTVSTPWKQTTGHAYH